MKETIDALFIQQLLYVIPAIPSLCDKHLNKIRNAVHQSAWGLLQLLNGLRICIHFPPKRLLKMTRAAYLCLDFNKTVGTQNTQSATGTFWLTHWSETMYWVTDHRSISSSLTFILNSHGTSVSSSDSARQMIASSQEKDDEIISSPLRNKSVVWKYLGFQRRRVNRQRTCYKSTTLLQDKILRKHLTLLSCCSCCSNISFSVLAVSCGIYISDYIYAVPTA